GNVKAIAPFQDALRKADLKLTTVRNPDQAHALEGYLPLLRKDAAGASRNADVVNVGVDARGVDAQTWNPVLGSGESVSQVVLALMLLREIPNLKGATSAQILGRLRALSNRLFPGMR